MAGPTSSRVLVVADADRIAELAAALVEPLSQGAIEVLVSTGGDDTIDLFGARAPAVVVVTASLEAGDSRALIETLRGMVPRAHVSIVVVGDDTGPIRTPLDAGELQADKFVGRPLAPKALRFAVGAGLEAVALATPAGEAPPMIDDDPTASQRAARRARWESLADSLSAAVVDGDAGDDASANGHAAPARDGAAAAATAVGAADDAELPPPITILPRNRARAGADAIAPVQAWQPGTTADLGQQPWPTSPPDAVTPVLARTTVVAEPAAPLREPTLILHDPPETSSGAEAAAAAAPAVGALDSGIVTSARPVPPLVGVGELQSPPRAATREGIGIGGDGEIIRAPAVIAAAPAVARTPTLEGVPPAPIATPTVATHQPDHAAGGERIVDGHVPTQHGLAVAERGSDEHEVWSAATPLREIPERDSRPAVELPPFDDLAQVAPPHAPTPVPLYPDRSEPAGAVADDEIAPFGDDDLVLGDGTSPRDPSGELPRDAGVDADLHGLGELGGLGGGGGLAIEVDDPLAARDDDRPAGGRDFARQLRAKMSQMAIRLFQGGDQPAPAPNDLAPRHDHHTEIDLASLGEELPLGGGNTELESRASMRMPDHRDLVTSPGSWDTQIRERGLPDSGEIVRGISDAAALLAKMFSSEVTGRVRFRRDDHLEVLVYFDLGRPVFASSSEPSDRMGELLVREGKITLAQYERCQTAVAESGRRMGEILVDLGYLKRRELLPAVRRHVEDLVYGLFGWDHGHYHVHVDTAPSAERIRLSRHPASLILEGIRRKLDRATLERLVGPASTVIEVADRDRVAAILNLGDLVPEERAALAAFDGQADLAQVARATQIDIADLLPLAWGLVVLGLATARRTDAELPDESNALVGETDLAIDRERVRARWRLVTDADYFALLGVRNDATAFEIRRAYQAARRDFAADGFPSDLRRELARELDDIAHVLDEAFRVLRDDRLRVTYLSNLVDE